MKMLRYIIVTLFATMATNAFAWTAEVNKAVLMLAEENLSKKTAKVVESLLDKSLSSIELANSGECKTRLDEMGKSVTTDENDAVVKLEKAVATLENKGATAEERKAALLTAVEMTVDIHCMANILIDKHLEKDFDFRGHNAMQVGFRYYSPKSFNWQKLWHQEYHNRHEAFSTEMYLFDWHIATKGMAKSYKKEPVAPRKWAEQIGVRAFDALKILQPDAVVENSDIAKLEEMNDACLYDASFHLANLLNNTFKQK